MTRSGDPRLLRGLLSHRVLVLSNTLARAAARYYPGRFGVRLPEWRVIDALHAGRGITANQISQWLQTDKAWVGRSVERLIAGGFVRRRPDPGHGRRLLLTLTSKGERAYSAIAAAAQRRHDNVLRVLSAEERRTLESILARLQLRAEEMLGEPQLGFSTAARRTASRAGGRSRRKARGP